MAFTLLLSSQHRCTEKMHILTLQHRDTHNHRYCFNGMFQLIYLYIHENHFDAFRCTDKRVQLYNSYKCVVLFLWSSTIHSLLQGMCFPSLAFFLQKWYNFFRRISIALVWRSNRFCTCLILNGFQKAPVKVKEVSLSHVCIMPAVISLEHNS